MKVNYFIRDKIGNVDYVKDVMYAGLVSGVLELHTDRGFCYFNINEIISATVEVNEVEDER